MSDAPLLDLEHLAHYTGGEPVLEAELFALFSTQVENCVGQMEAASADEIWLTAAHTLKGASRGVGAMNLADACAQAEESPLDPDRLADVRNRAHKTLREIRTVMESRL